jgi:acyl carrier protein
MNANDDRVAGAFRTVMRLDGTFELRDEMGYDDIPGWDSIAHMNLIVELESQFGITLGMEDIAVIDSVKAAREAVARNINKAS